jgi:hypothetical protein
MAHHNPGGVSINTAAQFAQNHISGKHNFERTNNNEQRHKHIMIFKNWRIGETFIPYDFGWWRNYARYGQIRPPPYDLSKVTCPVYLFYGENGRYHSCFYVIIILYAVFFLNR